MLLVKNVSCLAVNRLKIFLSVIIQLCFCKNIAIGFIEAFSYCMWAKWAMPMWRSASPRNNWIGLCRYLQKVEKKADKDIQWLWQLWTWCSRMLSRPQNGNTNAQRLHEAWRRLTNVIWDSRNFIASAHLKAPHSTISELEKTETSAAVTTGSQHSSNLLL